MTLVKICGLLTVEDAIFTAKAGADFIGLVFAEGRRQVDMDTAAEIIRGVHSLNTNTGIIGVFVNTPSEEVNRIVSILGLDRVQLSGDETWEYCLHIGYPIIKVIHITGTKTAPEIIDELDAGSRLMANRNWMFLLDTAIDGKYGGTGRTFNWSIAAEVAQRFPAMIAGGLDPDNVAKAVSQVKPLGVDVSTGIETDKQKDRIKITKFINAVKGDIL